MIMNRKNAFTSAGTALVALLLSSGCASSGNQRNPAYFKGGQWTGVRAGAWIDNPIVCMTANAKDAASFGDAVQDGVIPKL